ncbi:hypothetical protein Sjap_017515 [Stephania japonica]|uniref:NAC domain-containing protein n=1 Tax=Stephania japonica TaxID=461633 RepID=A0AAP0I6E7_9MAGN
METTSPLVLPCGYVFAPKDSELLATFSSPKYKTLPSNSRRLRTLRTSTNMFRHPHNRVNKKHANGSRLSRSIAGQKGFWRASTGVKKVRGYNGQLLGKRTPLNYYEGKNSKTDWIMQEYILAPPQDHRTPNKTSMLVKLKEAQSTSEEAMLPLMIVNQGHPSSISTIRTYRRQRRKHGITNNIASTSINCSSDHHDVQDVHVNSFSSDFCDIDTHPDVVALPNVESMVETTEVLEEQEGVDWLRDFPQFEPADLEFSDWEADAWDNEFALV